MASLKLSLLLVFAACGNPPGDADPPGDANPPGDAGLLGGADLEIAAHCARIESLSLPTTQLGQTANAFVQFTNGGAVIERNLPTGFRGSNASEFKVSKPCENELAPGAICVMEVRFTPTDLGDKEAILYYGARELPLAGSAVPRSSGLFANVANLDYLSGLGGPNGPLSFVVSNQGTSDVTTDASQMLADDGLQLLVNACPFRSPDGTCGVSIGVDQLVRGCLSDTLHLVSDAGTIDLPITSEYLAIATVSVASLFGEAQGRVTSDPPGIDCAGMEQRCTTRADADATIYRAAPAEGDHFIGWSEPSCGMSPQCTVSVGPLFRRPEVIAYFVPASAKAIEVSFGGDGAGRVNLFTQSAPRFAQTCYASCTMYVPADDTPTLHAFAKSQFGGWAGACSDLTPTCLLEPSSDDRQVTVTFNRDSHELDTVGVPSARLTTAFLPDGDFVVSDSASLAFGSRVSRVGPDGAVHWTRFIQFPKGIATSAESVYILTSDSPPALSSLHKLSSDGELQWRVSPAIGPPIAIASHGDDVLVVGETNIEARAVADGALRWSTAIDKVALNDRVKDMAVGPDGIIAILVNSTIQRLSATGTPLPSWFAPGHGDGTWHLAYDSAGNLATLSDRSYPDMRPATLSRFSPSGIVTFSVDLDTTPGTAGGLGTAGGMLLAVGDKIVALRHHMFQPQGAQGAFLETYNATGALLWRVEKAAVRVVPDVPESGFTGFTRGVLLPAPDGSVALVGQNSYFVGTQIERFAP